MAKVQKRKRVESASASKQAQLVQEDKRRIARELAAVRRVSQLSKQLEHAAARAETATFTLGRELVIRNGFAVVSQEHSTFLQTQNNELRARVEQLERELASVSRDVAHA